MTDAENQTSFEGVPFANTMLLSSKHFALDPGSQKERDGVDGGKKFMIDLVSRVTPPSKFGRCALSVDIVSPSISTTVYRLINVHLDSLRDTFPYRTEQMDIIAKLLQEPGYGGGLIAGDFDAISLEDHNSLDKSGLVDAWLALHRKEGLDGATWGIEIGRRDGLGPGRLDKVAMLRIDVKEIEILRPGLIEVPKPGEDSDCIPYSDCCGIRLRFTVYVFSSTFRLALPGNVPRVGFERIEQ